MNRYLILITLLGIFAVLFVSIYFTNSNSVKLDPTSKDYNFQLKDIDGEVYSLKDELKSRPVVIAFYATWCPTCQVSAPKLSQMASSYSSQLSVWGINSKESLSDVRKFVDKNSITHPVLMDEKGLVAIDYGVGYNNFYVLINKDGTIYKKATGEILESDLVDLIDYNLN